MTRTHRCLTLALGLLAFSAAPASAQSLWTDVDESSLRVDPAARITTPTEYRVVQLDLGQMDARLVTAGRRAGGGGISLSIPLPEGGVVQVEVTEASILAPELQAKFPEIRTYLAQGMGSVTGRLSLTPAGFRGMLSTPEGTVYIDPYVRDQTEYYVVYYSRDLQVDPDLRGRIEDQVLGASASPTPRRQGTARAHGETLRTYRLAVAATGEYTAFHGGTVAGALAAIANTVNRITGIYERDLSVSFQLVSDNDQIVYTDASTDPYANTSGDLTANQSTIDAVIGSANYDVGHLVGTNGGGVASLGVICNTSAKARGLTGSFRPVGDSFDIDFVAHEIGHQFSGNHTFNGDSGSCSGQNRNGSTAYEPGSGSTIQAYAGICGNDNIQSRSDAYFHGVSLDEMTAHVTTGSGGTCGTTTATNNTVPTVTVPAGFTIPAGTPFSLTGSATDDTPESLTYTWEEFDRGPQADVNAGTVPFFRSFLPSASPTRSFPQRDRLVAGLAPVVGEHLPTDAQTMTFRLTARDNRAGGGAINDASTTVTTVDTGAPFAVTFASTASRAYSTTANVTWDVAGTDTGAINTPTVDILFSTDDGQTFPTVLASATPNDGSHQVTFPSLTTQGRVLIRAVGNVFYNVNAQAFTVTDASIASLSGAMAATPITLGPSEAARVTLTVSNDGTIDATGVRVDLDAMPTLTDIVFAGEANVSDGIFESQGSLRLWTVDVAAGTSETLAYNVVVGREAARGTLAHTATLTHPSIDSGSTTVSTNFQIVTEQTGPDIERVQSVAIPDNGCPVFAESTIEVPSGLNPSEIRVGVNLTHTWRGDLDVRVQSPAGTEISLIQFADRESDNLDALFFDGGGALATGNHNISAPFYDNQGAPRSPLAPLAAEDPAGTWRLRVCDDAGQDTGQINRWALSLLTDVVSAPTVSGGPGWRMLSPGASGVAVSDLAALNLVQGVPDYYPGAETTLYTEYDGTAYTAASGASQSLPPGRGFFWFFYDNDLDPGGASASRALPTALTATGAPVTADTGVALHASGDGFNLLGNPFATSLDLSGIASWPGNGSLESDIAQIYNGVAGTYETSATRSAVSPWQAFWVEADVAQSAGTLTIPVSAQTTGGVLTRAEPHLLIAFELTGGPYLDRAAVVTFSEDASAGRDRGDASKLAPLDAAHVMVALGDPDAPLAVDNRPMAMATVQLSVASVGAGADLELSWPRIDALPDDWTAVLTDLETGASLDLVETKSYAFSVTPKEARTGSGLAQARLVTGLSPRFQVAIGPSNTVSSEQGAGLALTLGAPRPNPTASGARLALTLADAGAVRAEVYDALGRRVAVLADESMTSGRHDLTVETGELAPGTYVVRVVAGDAVLVRTLTVIR